MLEVIEDVAVWVIFTVYRIYTIVMKILLKLFFTHAKRIVKKRFLRAGITLNGDKPYDITVLNEQSFYIRTATERNVGMFESYMEGGWTTKDMRSLAIEFMRRRKTKLHQHPLTWVLDTFNLQTKSKAWEVGLGHYDVGNDIYESMLGKYMQYSCGYWKSAKNLDEAQAAKMDLIGQKLKLEPGMKVLDIGCGFGTLAYFLAQNYGVSVVGCSISKEQTKYGESLCKKLPVEFRLCDYRDLNEKFDRIVSVGMFEHVGPKNYSDFFQVANRCLKDDGLFVLQTIGNNHRNVNGFDMWSHKYIFPNGRIPHYTEVCHEIDRIFVIEDWQNFGFDYSRTLKAWEENFDAAWPDNLSKRYGNKFYRMWKLYLNFAQGYFATRSFQVWQLVLSKDGLQGGYYSPR